MGRKYKKKDVFHGCRNNGPTMMFKICFCRKCDPNGSQLKSWDKDIVTEILVERRRGEKKKHIKGKRVRPKNMKNLRSKKIKGLIVKASKTKSFRKRKMVRKWKGSTDTQQVGNRKMRASKKNAIKKISAIYTKK